MSNVLDAIGNTSIIKLNKVVPENCADIYVKLEWENPTGSMKDRMAQAMIANAEKDGRLKPSGTIVEYTGGSTGASLTLICAVKGYNIKIVTSDAFSKEKLDHMEKLGAELTVIPSHGKGFTEELFKKMIATAHEISKEPGTYWSDQLNNEDHIAGYYPLGQEIWDQTYRKIDTFVQTFGTMASTIGVSKILKEKKPEVIIAAVEPAESPFVSEGISGSHGIDGVSIGFLPPLQKLANIDEFLKVSTQEAKEMQNRLAREEGIFAGTSSGSNVVAAIELGKRLDPGKTIVTLMIDSGLKYLK